MWELGGRINEGNRGKQRITHEAKEGKHQRQFLTFERVSYWLPRF